MLVNKAIKDVAKAYDDAVGSETAAATAFANLDLKFSEETSDPTSVDYGKVKFSVSNTVLAKDTLNAADAENKIAFDVLVFGTSAVTIGHPTASATSEIEEAASYSKKNDGIELMKLMV